MTQYIWKNRAFGTLAAAITNSQTTITLSSGQGALFPSPVSPQVFTLVLQSATNSTLYEITYCTGRSGDTLTLERAQEGTTGLAFNAGDLAQNLVTAGALDYGDYFPTGLGAITANTTLTGASAGNYYNVGGSAETFISLNAATFTAGQTIGFRADQVAGISTTSGVFYGGSLPGTSSFTMPKASFIALQFDGVNWRQLAGSFLSGMGQNGGAFNSGNPNISASVSFTPLASGVVIVTGAAAQNGGGISSIGFTASGATVLNAYGNTTSGAVSNLAASGNTLSVVFGVPVTITYSMTGTGNANSFTNIGFTYVLIPIS